MLQKYSQLVHRYASALELVLRTSQSLPKFGVHNSFLDVYYRREVMMMIINYNLMEQMKLTVQIETMLDQKSTIAFLHFEGN